MEFNDSQAASRLELLDGTVLTKCDQCEAYYAELNPPGIPPCDTCRVELLPGNKATIDVFYACRDQALRAGMDGVIVGIDMNSLWHTIDHYPGGIKDPWKVMLQVKELFHHFRPERGE